MQLFIDCEFTDFIGLELISIAIVASTGAEFYGEVSDFDEAACSGFVREAVLPQLARSPDSTYTREELREALLRWLHELSSGAACLVCADNVNDWDLLIDLLGDVPPNCQGILVAGLIDQALREDYFERHGGRHHALHDARALKAAVAVDVSAAMPVAKQKPTRSF